MSGCASWRGSARRRGRRRRRLAAPPPGSRTTPGPRRPRDVDGAGYDVVQLDGVRPVEPTGGDSVDEVAALDAAADRVVTHDGGAALDDVGADLAAVVLRRSDRADQRSVGDRGRGEQRCRARRRGHDHVGVGDRGRCRRRRDGGDPRGSGTRGHRLGRVRAVVVDAELAEERHLVGEHLHVGPALAAGTDDRRDAGARGAKARTASAHVAGVRRRVSASPSSVHSSRPSRSNSVTTNVNTPWFVA